MTSDLQRAGAFFVGRTQEMEILRADLDQTLEGRGRLVLLEGEPGIGKTTSAHEVATYARTRGAQVLWGRCDSGAGAPPYWPWVQIFRSYANDTRDVPAVLAAGLADIARVVSAIAEDPPSAAPQPPVAADQDRFRLFDSITVLLKNVAGHQPLLLIIDDLHAADAPSLLLLQFLVRQLADMHLMVIAAYRDVEVDRQHPLFRILGELVREPVTRRLTLRGLSQVEVGEYLALSVDNSVMQAAAVYRETEGNPFFIGEVVRLFVSEGRLVRPPATEARPWELPRGVRETVGRRLDRLSSACHHLLRLAAVVGHDFHINLLERAGDTPHDALVHVLEEAIGARIVAEIPASAGRYAFSHALIRETLYAELTTTERIRLHRRVADALEVLTHEPHLTELAHHYFAAAHDSGAAEKALFYALRAGEAATRQMAHEEALRHYEMALQICDVIQTDGSTVHTVLLLIADAAWCTGEVAKAQTASLRAIDLARHVDSAEQFARAALGYAGRLPVFGVVDPDLTVITLLREAMRALDDTDSALRVLVMARLAEEQTLSESHEERWVLACQAVEMARRIKEPAILAAALKGTFFAYWDPLRLDERLGASDELIDLAVGVQDRTLGLEGHMFRFIGLVEKGEAIAAEQELDICDRAARNLRQPYHDFVVAVLRGCLASMQGRLDEIEQLAQHALELGHRATAKSATMWCGVQLHRLLWLQGRFQELEPQVHAVIAAHPLVNVNNRAALALTYAEQGRVSEARTQFDMAAAHEFDDVPRHLAWQFTIAQLAEVCAVLHDRPRAVRLYELLRPLDGRNLTIALLATLGPAAYYLGLLATVLGRWEHAERHFEDALLFDLRTGARQQRARTHVAYAAMLLTKDGAGDAERAVAHLDQARHIATELGMQRLAQRADEIAARYEMRRSAEATPAASAQTASRAQPVAPAPMDVAAVVLRQEGEFWTVAQGDTVLRFKDAKGFHYLAQLLRSPGRELHALELVSESSASNATAKDHTTAEAHTRNLSGAGPLLDSTAKRQYKDRLAGLLEQLKEADSFNDTGRAAALRFEIEALSQQLGAAVGLGGRDRSARSSAERARWAVTKGIKGVVDKIRRGNPQLGRHLANCLHTGYVCSYQPNPDWPIRWIL